MNPPKAHLPGKGASCPPFGEGGCPFEPGRVRGTHFSAGDVGVPTSAPTAADADVECKDSPVRIDNERDASDACALLCQRAFQVIRASAYRRESVDAPDAFQGDYVDWIRLLADACDGLAHPAPSATEALAYRQQVWEPAQAAWVATVID